LELADFNDLVNNDASTARPKSFSSLGSQRAAGIGPFERFGHGLVEVVNEVQDALTQFMSGRKAGPFEQFPH
jgi:hypothetical protein